MVLLKLILWIAYLYTMIFISAEWKRLSGNPMYIPLFLGAGEEESWSRDWGTRSYAVHSTSNAPRGHGRPSARRSPTPKAFKTQSVIWSVGRHFCVCLHRIIAICFALSQAQMVLVELLYGHFNEWANVEVQPQGNGGNSRRIRCCVALFLALSF